MIIFTQEQSKRQNKAGLERRNDTERLLAMTRSGMVGFTAVATLPTAKKFPEQLRKSAPRSGAHPATPNRACPILPTCHSSTWQKRKRRYRHWCTEFYLDASTIRYRRSQNFNSIQC